MKKILLFVCILLCYGTVYAEGSIDVSKDTITIKKGETQEFVVTANNAAGLVLIKSSDDEIVTADVNKYFFDSEDNEGKTLSVKLTGKKEGSANVEIILEDVSSYDEEAIEGTKVLTVTVNGDGGAVNPTNNPTAEPGKADKSGSNTIYYVIGGVVVLAMAGLGISMTNKKKQEGGEY